MIRKFLLLCGLLPLAVSGNAQPTPAPAVFAIVGAKIEIGDGRVIEKPCQFACLLGICRTRPLRPS